MNRFLILLALLAAALPAGAANLSSEEGPLLRLRNATFDPAAPGARSLSLSFPTAYKIVQFTGPVQSDWKTSLEDAGTRIFDYVPDYAFVCHIPAEAVSEVWKLPFVRAVTPYLPSYRINPQIVKVTGAATANISLFPGADPLKLVEVARANGLQAHQRGRVVSVSGDAELIRALAGAEGVRWIEARPKKKLHNDRGRVIMGVNSVWTDLGLYGEGQILGFMDTGLDSGNFNRLGEDFAGKVIAGTGRNVDDDWADRYGHGTHVAGIMASRGILSGAIPEEKKYSRSFAGVAPEAKLVVQEIDVDDTTNESQQFDENSDMFEIFQWAYDHGARIHNNSWGDDNVTMGEYTFHASQIDEFVWKNPDFAVFFAAGNEGVDSEEQRQLYQDMANGEVDFFELIERMEEVEQSQDGMVDPGSISPPSTAKNAITVGASEGNRAPGSGGYSDQTYAAMFFFAEPITSDYFSDNVDGMAAFSSRGPTLDGRTKPDIVAPGTNIISNRSPLAPDSHYWGTYNVNYAFAGGTSMSSPFAAGSAALVREWLQKKRGVPQPSAALIKGLLVNGAYEMDPGQYADPQEISPRPNSVEGWGRVDLANTLMPTAPRVVSFSDEKAGLKTVAAKSFPYRVKVGTPLSVSLVWSDYPATPAAEKALVNDLDLFIKGPNGQTWTGNGVEDRLNNVEGVDIAEPAAGDYTVEIKGINIPNGPQPYALVVSGDVVRVDGTTPTKPGDVNFDSEVNAVDAVFILRHIVGMETLSPEQHTAADVSPLGAPDALVDVNDAITVLRAAVGQITL